MGKSDSLLACIGMLERENGLLKRKLALLGSGSIRSCISVPDQRKVLPASVAVIDGMYCQVDRDQRIVNLNTSMAVLLSFPKERLLGTRLADVDRLPWATGILCTLLDESDAINDDVELETRSQDVVSGTERVLLFRASWHDGIGNIAVSDRSAYARILSVFRKYVSPAVVARMQDSAVDFFKTERQMVTVLFADLRGFTAMSSSMPPEEVERTINEYIGMAVAAIDEVEGTVDKIMGDGIMAIFGAPLETADHAYRAIRCAIAMQKAHALLRVKWESEGRPALALGVGLDTGEVVVGNIGCDARTAYTALGHHVNLASRICGAAEGGEILASSDTLEAISRYWKDGGGRIPEKLEFRKVGDISLKGIPAPVRIVSVGY